MDGNRVWWVDKVNRILIYMLFMGAIWGTMRWASVQSMRAELTQTIQDIAVIQEQAARIIRLQTAVDIKQDILTQQIDSRLDRIEGNTDTIKQVLVTKTDGKGAGK